MFLFYENKLTKRLKPRFGDCGVFSGASKSRDVMFTCDVTIWMWRVFEPWFEPEYQ